MKQNNSKHFEVITGGNTISIYDNEKEIFSSSKGIWGFKSSHELESYKTALTNAEMICKCVNGYEALKKQNEDLIFALKTMKQEYQEYQRQTGNAWGLKNTKAEQIAIETLESATTNKQP